MPCYTVVTFWVIQSLKFEVRRYFQKKLDLPCFFLLNMVKCAAEVTLQPLTLYRLLRKQNMCYYISLFMVIYLYIAPSALGRHLCDTLLPWCNKTLILW
jgi:hypothetical protein